MDNLVYDLKQKALNKQKANKHKHYHRQQVTQRNKYYTRISSTLINNQSNDKRKKLMKVIIATAQAASVDNDSNSRSSLLFKNLVRIKRFDKLKGSKKSILKNSLLRKKKTSFRIQKTYRFRNYRLRCIRLRQSQLKERRQLLKHKTKPKMKSKKTKSNLVSSSCAETSDSNQTTTSNNINTSSSGEDTLSLIECFKQTKFLNGSSTKEEEDFKRESQLNKKHRNAIHCIKQAKNSFKKKLKSLTSKSLMIKENRYLNLKKTQLFCDCRYCNFKPIKKKDDPIQQFDLNKMYLKRKRFVKEDDVDDAKKVKCELLDYSLSSIQSSGEDTSNFKDDNIDSSIKSDDTDESSNSSNNLKQIKKVNNFRFKSKSLSETDEKIDDSSSVEKSKNFSSNEEDDLDDTGADDEQSDWPANENTCIPVNDSNKIYAKSTTKSVTQLINSSNSSLNQIDYLSDAFKITPKL